MKKLLPLFFMLTLFFLSCKKDTCDCMENWDDSIQYFESDLVWYNDTCWVALHGGRGIIPGPWQQNGNDIWMVCEE